MPDAPGLMPGSCAPAQITAAIVSAAVPVDGGRGWTSFGLLLFELNLIVWVGYYSDRNAGNAIKELEVCCLGTLMALTYYQ